jgi:hypothetical protein
LAENESLDTKQTRPKSPRMLGKLSCLFVLRTEVPSIPLHSTCREATHDSPSKRRLGDAILVNRLLVVTATLVKPPAEHWEDFSLPRGGPPTRSGDRIDMFMRMVLNGIEQIFIHNARLKEATSRSPCRLDSAHKQDNLVSRSHHTGSTTLTPIYSRWCINLPSMRT